MSTLFQAHLRISRMNHKFDPQEIEALARVHLQHVQPIHRPYFLPGYGGTPIVIAGNRGADGRIVPLRLALDEGVQTFARGMGTGCHAEYLLAYDLPAGVYRMFSTVVGLHTELGRRGAIEVEIRVAGQTQFADRFD